MGEDSSHWELKQQGTDLSGLIVQPDPETQYSGLKADQGGIWQNGYNSNAANLSQAEGQPNPNYNPSEQYQAGEPTKSGVDPLAGIDSDYSNNSAIMGNTAFNISSQPSTSDNAPANNATTPVDYNKQAEENAQSIAKENGYSAPDQQLSK